jgi:hypothetical protein
MAAILTLARFCEPSSELHIADTWYRRTALEELLGVTPEQVHTDRLYKALDELLPHKEALEKHLRQRLGELFELKCDLLLYDVTSTHFEGDMQGCPIAKRGYSRDSRPDRPQVCLGLVVTEGSSEEFVGELLSGSVVAAPGRFWEAWQNKGKVAGEKKRPAESELGGRGRTCFRSGSVIPWRVAPQQSPPPFHRTSTSIKP